MVDDAPIYNRAALHRHINLVCHMARTDARFDAVLGRLAAVERTVGDIVKGNGKPAATTPPRRRKRKYNPPTPNRENIDDAAFQRAAHLAKLKGL